MKTDFTFKTEGIVLSWGLGAMCQWQMFSTNRSEAKMRECKAYSNPAFEKLTDKYARVHIDTGGSV